MNRIHFLNILIVLKKITANPLSMFERQKEYTYIFSISLISYSILCPNLKFQDHNFN